MQRLYRRPVVESPPAPSLTCGGGCYRRGLQLTVTGDAATEYDVQFSTDLDAWSSLAKVTTDDTGKAVFTDAASPRTGQETWVKRPDSTGRCCGRRRGRVGQATHINKPPTVRLAVFFCACLVSHAPCVCVFHALRLPSAKIAKKKHFSPKKRHLRYSNGWRRSSGCYDVFWGKTGSGEHSGCPPYSSGRRQARSQSLFSGFNYYPIHPHWHGFGSLDALVCSKPC